MCPPLSFLPHVNTTAALFTCLTPTFLLVCACLQAQSLHSPLLSSLSIHNLTRPYLSVLPPLPTLSSPSIQPSAESFHRFILKTNSALFNPSGTFLGHSRTGACFIFRMTVFSVTELLRSIMRPQLLNKVSGGKKYLLWILAAFIQLT